MLLFAAVLLGVITVPLAGGRLSNLADVKLRFVPAVLIALVLQVAIISVFPGGNSTLHRVVHVGSYLLAASFLVANRKVAGMWIVALGTALNLLAIMANNGVMPASAAARRSAGMVPTNRGFGNSTVVTHPRLQFLGDVFAVPAHWPLHNVLQCR